MAWRELIFSALFLYVISPTTCTEIRHCSPSYRNFPGDNRGQHGMCCIHASGMVKINHVTRGFICSGFHLKPGLIGTAASCVYGRDAGEFLVTTSWEKRWNDVASKPVQNILIHPDYKQGLKYNFALMKIDNSRAINTFELYPNDITPSQMIRDIIRIYVNEWEGTSQEIPIYYGKEFYATENFSVCGEFVSNPDWYCVFKNGYNPTYKEWQVGSPVYFRDRHRKIQVIGIYTEADLCEEANGTLFQKIHPVVSWVKSKLSGI